MSWNNTYSHTVVLALDRFGAAVFFNEADITISSLCWIVLNNGKDPVATRSFVELKLSNWQVKTLTFIGSALERFSPGHCAAAREGDKATGARSIALLT